MALLLMLMLALATRALMAHFVAAHFTDAAWFQYGSYAVLDERAQNILDGKESPIWIEDASRTDMAQYPPGFPLWMALIYKLTGMRSPSSVQSVQWVMDALAVWLVAGIGVTAFSWRVGFLAGFLAALSPLLAMYGAYPMTDAPTSWLVLGGVWMLVLSAKRRSVAWAIGAGLVLGLACWLRVNPLFLIFVWAAALLVLVHATWRRRMIMSGALIASFALAVAPVIIRNLAFWPEFVPTGLSVGTNLWEGIGETERGSEFGAFCCDQPIIEEERRAMNLPQDFPIKNFWPDGIRRDRERGARALAVIRAHPIWYAGTMLRRMMWMFKYAGRPSPSYGSMGVNVTSSKCLPESLQGGLLGFFVNTLGALQSVMRYLLLPLILCGTVFAWLKDRSMTLLIFITIIYYMLTLSIGHSEARYGLPMQALLLVFAGLAVCRLYEIAEQFKSKKAKGRQK